MKLIHFIQCKAVITIAYAGKNYDMLLFNLIAAII